MPGSTGFSVIFRSRTCNELVAKHLEVFLHTAQKGIIHVALIEILEKVSYGGKSENESVHLEEEFALVRRELPRVPHVTLPATEGLHDEVFSGIIGSTLDIQALGVRTIKWTGGLLLWVSHCVDRSLVNVRSPGSSRQAGEGACFINQHRPPWAHRLSSSRQSTNSFQCAHRPLSHSRHPTLDYEAEASRRAFTKGQREFLVALSRMLDIALGPVPIMRSVGMTNNPWGQSRAVLVIMSTVLRNSLRRSHLCPPNRILGMAPPIPR